MPTAANLPITLIIEAIAGLAIAGLIASIAVQLFASAKAANDHVASGMALGAPAKVQPEVLSARPGGADVAPLSPAPGGIGLTPPHSPAPGGIGVAPPRSSAPGDGGAIPARSAAPSDGEAVTPIAVPADADAAGQIFAQLNAYYAANINAGNTIFWASLLSMCIGFAIIFFGVVVAQTNGVTAIVAAVAGVLSQFIAATFLVALRSTQQQATTYAQTLVELRLRDVARAADARAVKLGLRLLSEISADRSNPANVTKATIAAGLIVKGPATIYEPPVVTVEPPGTERFDERPIRRGGVTFGDTGAPERR